jgi:hypothetical protein
LTTTPTLNGHIDVAVADMHAGGLSRNIFGKLWNRQMHFARQLEWEDTPRAGGRQALMFTQRALCSSFWRTMHKLGWVSHAISPWMVVSRMKCVYLTLSFDIQQCEIL